MEHKTKELNKSCHKIEFIPDIPKDAKKIVLVGNPNVGKSVFFQSLTGMYVDVSNFPGTTVDINYGKYNENYVIDTPGVYGVSSFNDEEIVARDVILNADVVINIVDALHMERDLFLTQQIIDMGKPIVIALNMMDEVRKNGIEIDIEKLSELLGVEIIPTIAIKNKGIVELKEAITRARLGNRDESLLDEMEAYRSIISQYSEALLILEDDEEILRRYNITKPVSRERIYRNRREYIDNIINRVTIETNKGISFVTRLSRYMLYPLTGIPILIAVLYLMYQFIGVFVAQTIVDITEGIIMGNFYLNFIKGIFEGFLSSDSILGTILIGEFGLLTMVPIYIIGLLLPLVIGFYFLLSIMEDTGYLPRVATLVDRSLTKIGLNGKAIIPMILGFGCVTMATITTRILGSRRERVIATALLGLTIPCSAQLGVIAGLIAPLGLKYLVLYILTITIVFVLSGTVLNRFLPGKSSSLLIDLPSLRLPKAKNIAQKTFTKAWMFLKEAAPLFMLGSFVITIMQITGLLDGVQNIFAPITEAWLKLPKEAATAFIMGIIRRDFGAAGLTSLALTPMQTIISLIVITLFVPCIAAILVIFKERSWQESIGIWLGSFIIAFLVGGILAQILL
jgi:ferrous iron transport protein B